MTFYLVFHWHEEYCRFLVPLVVIVRITSHPLYCDLTYENEDFGKRDSEADEKKPLHAEENNTLHPSWRGDFLLVKVSLHHLIVILVNKLAAAASSSKLRLSVDHLNALIELLP